MLTPGARLGALEVVGPLGAGGMAEVYRARDTRLDRDVALKVLPEAVAEDADRLARFEREARLLAALNHPGIAAIHGLERCNGRPLLVLELVEGPTLAERLRRGRLPLVEVLEVARQIAEALEAAHEKGIVHRDLKPSNIKLTPVGKVKLLDFGLAKAIAHAPESDVSNVSTDTSPTDSGVLLGTAPYMSPEQARGQTADRQTDVWAFACVLYEMLTGRRAFAGATRSDVIASVLRAQPDWQLLPADTPVRIRSLLQRCLQKDNTRRLHDIGDARIEIEEAGTESAPLPRAPQKQRRFVITTIALLGAAAIVSTALWVRRRPPGAARSNGLRFVIQLPAGATLVRDLDTASHIALSPDGAKLVIAALNKDRMALYARPLDRLDAQLVSDSQGGHTPFFSPDGRWLGFSAQQKLKKVSVAGGRPEIIGAHGPGPRGASWGDDGSIVFTPSQWSGLSRLAPGAVHAEVLTTPSPDQGETSHRWPQVLPGSQVVLFGIHPLNGRQEEGQIAVFSLATRQIHVVLRGSMFARYAPTGHLVYASADAIHAVRFDLARFRVTGPPTLVVDGVKQSRSGTGVAQFDFSPRGHLAYIAKPRPDANSLVWVDRQGTARTALAEDRAYDESGMGLSSDGRYAVLAIEGPSNYDLWRCDLVSGTRARLTSESDNVSAVVSPADDRVVFTSDRAGPNNLFLVSAAGGPPKRLTSSRSWQHPTGWTPDGRTVIFGNQSTATGWDIWAVEVDGDRDPRPLLATPFGEGGAVVSPDGRWLAYASNESGRVEIYVRSYPGLDQRWQISTEGGVNPVWAAHGRELFYMNKGAMMAAPVRTRPVFTAGVPKMLFSGRYRNSALFGPAAFAVTAGGQRFLMVQDHEDQPPLQVVFIPNWFDELNALVPSASP